MKPHILIGPMLRYLSATAATVWLETDQPCEVTLTLIDPQDNLTTDFTQTTWTVHGHHYTLLTLTGLRESTTYEYRISCDGAAAWPLPEIEETFGPSRIRTHDRDAAGRIVFGSCRRAAPLKGWGLASFGADALAALAYRLRQTDPRFWPDMLMLAGDQVYADELDSAAERFVQERRAGASPWSDDGWDDVAEEACSYDEYAWLYSQSWTPAPLRWLFSTVSSSMILDDHDLRDDWNISKPWRDRVSERPWWQTKVTGAFASYWVYQHLGNLSPDALASDPLYHRVLTSADETERSALLDDFAVLADEQPDSARWSYFRDLGNDQHRIRVVVVDSRCSRVLEPDNRQMLDDVEFGWVEDRLTEDEFDHLVIVSTLPVFLPSGIHYLEAWNEAMANGRWSGRPQRVAERIRQGLDLEHWAAFGGTMTRFLDLLGRTARGPGAPRSITVLSGDVHCSYLAAVELPGVDPATHPVWQVTVSPFRNPLDLSVRLGNRLAAKALTGEIMWLVAKMAGAVRVPARWAITNGPWFANALGVLDFSGQEVKVTLEHAHHVANHHLLRPTITRRLSATPTDVVQTAKAHGRPTTHRT